jgi:predicted 2-oxoglutarate/Fe(II)-dependent dioxygenase YbiX
MSNSPKYLAAGDRAPNSTGITAEGAVYASESQSGRAVAMILCRNLDVPELIPLLGALSAQADEFSSREVDLVAMIGEDVSRVLGFKIEHPSRVTLIGALDTFLEQNAVKGKLPEVMKGSPKDFMERIGFESKKPEILILDRNQRVAGRIVPDSVENMVAQTLAVVKALPFETPRDIFAPAPVLILHNLLDPDLCEELIEMHKADGGSESPSLMRDEQGRPGHKVDHRLKKRRDFLLERDHPMSVRLTDIVMRRVVPEIKRCFQAEVTHMDRFNVACYPGDGGHFRRHRDNRPELVSFRRFALSINLTSPGKGYEGGYLRLPEFNNHHYCCPTGAGVTFSVALLHEITPVLSGNRYVLVTHLHDDEGEIKWLEMRKTLAGVV